MKLRMLAAIGVLGLAIQPPAHAEVTARGVSASDLVALISAPDSAHAHAAAKRLLLAAEAGNSYAMYDIGTFSRQLQRTPGAAFAYEPGGAIQWLLRAFDAGRISAAYKLALTYRDIGDTLEAMAWAQVYSHFSKANAKSDGAIASLLANLYRELGEGQTEAIRLRTIALLQQHGPQFEAAKQSGVNFADLGDIAIVEDCAFPRPMPRGLWQKGGLRESAFIEALLQLDAEGKPQQVHLLDFSRKALNAERTHRLVEALRCPVDANAATRWTFVNIPLDDRRYNLAPR